MFRGARRSDLEQILEIYAHARKAMADSGNPTQWGDSYPPQEMLEEDIDSNRLFVYTVNGCLEAVFAFILGPDPTYHLRVKCRCRLIKQYDIRIHSKIGRASCRERV